ncbi:hypothetical protein HanPI659440_Chr15g0581911 [Helianthus annuus]|nr:hypothetical protein HanPI659440_Chr15g0581911 [Helianthus annuus]
MIQEMPFEADLGVWGALLAGCRFSLNIELAELAARELMKLFQNKNKRGILEFETIIFTFLFHSSTLIPITKQMNQNN